MGIEGSSKEKGVKGYAKSEETIRKGEKGRKEKEKKWGRSQ